MRSEASSPSDRLQVLARSNRFSEYATILASALILTIVLAAAWAFPERFVLLPIAAVAAILATAAFVNERTGLVLAILGGVSVLNVGADSGPVQYAYMVYLALYLAIWYGRRIGHVPIVQSRLDVVAVVVIAMIPVSAAVGLALGAEIKPLGGETADLMPLALYFPVRTLCASRDNGYKLAIIALVLYGAATCLYTFWRTYDMLTNADAVWKVLRVRAAGGEVSIVTGFVLSTALLGESRRRAHVALSVISVGLTLVGLLLTKSRGYWLGAAVGGLAVWVFSPPSIRSRLNLRLVAMIVGGGALSYLLVGDLLITLGAGVLERIFSVSSAVTTDPSMLNRFRESEAVWALVPNSPVFGHGVGTTYSYYNAESEGTRNYSFIHNGLASLWFKQGAVGFFGTLGLWVGSLWCAFSMARRNALPMDHRMAALAAGAGLAANMVPIYTSSPFYLINIVLATTTLIGLASGLSLRAASMQEAVSTASS